MNKKVISKRIYYIYCIDGRKFRTCQRSLRKALDKFIDRTNQNLDYVDGIESVYIKQNGDKDIRTIPYKYFEKIYNKCLRRKNITI